MVKEKKLTKSSIAIIVLALLLIASLIMGMTGAWFTDVATKDNNVTSITLGKIDISAGEFTGTDTTSTDWAHALPGDRKDYAVTATVAADSENMYVLVTYNAVMAAASGDQSLLDAYISNDASDDTKAMTLTFAPGTLESTGYAAVAKPAEGIDLPANSVLYYVAKTNAAKNLAFSGSLIFNENTKNVVYTGDDESHATAARLNVADEAHDGTYTVTVSFGMKAIQQRHIVADGNVTAPTKTEWDALVGAISSAMLAEGTI